MEKWNGRVALVTGASSGIGWAIVKTLASHGLVVAACARNLEKLQELAESCKPAKVVPIECDLTKEDDIAKMFSRISSELGGIDICVNNAGLSTNAPLLSGKTDQWRQILDVNVLALCICTRESVKMMREKKVDDGFVVNICSLAGHRMFNAASGHFYMASKHMVKCLSEGTNNELKKLKSNIRVVEISPGVTQTDFFERSLGPKVSSSLFKAVPDPLLPEDIANSVVYAISQPPHVQVTEIIVKPTCYEV